MIRDFHDDDVGAVVPIVAAAEPWLTTERGFLHRVHHAPTRSHARWFVAEDAGDVVGVGLGAIEWHLAGGELAEVWVAVRPDRRGNGIGSVLCDAAEDHVRRLGVNRVRTEALDDRFARARGYELESRNQIWEIDLESFDADAPRVEADLRTLGDLRDRARELYDLYIGVEFTMPRGEQWTGYSFEEWELDTFRYPDLDDETSVVALVEGRMVACSLLLVSPDGEDAEVEVTGTLPDYRRRGLARACKVESMRRARARGVRRLMTDNDLTNEPMLALNRALGFRPAGIVFELAKRL